MDFEKVIRTRRSIRSFSSKEVSQETIEKILEAARIAPSGNNLQPWKFVVVRDKEKKEKIAQACYDQNFVARAPLVIVACGIPYPNKYEPRKELSYLVDTVIAVDHLILACRNEGIGTCWVGALHQEPIKNILGIPEGAEVVMVIPAGYPSREESFREVYGRKSLREIISYDQWIGEGVNK